MLEDASALPGCDADEARVVQQPANRALRTVLLVDPLQVTGTLASLALCGGICSLISCSSFRKYFSGVGV